MNKTDNRVLEFLLKHQYATNLNDFVKTFPKNLQPSILKSVRRLQNLDYISENMTSEGVVICLQKDKKKDALGMVSSIYIHDPSQDPIHELIPKNYRILETKNAEHKQNGGFGTYAICYNKKDKHDIKCFVRNTKGELKGIKLGSIYDPDSPISNWIKEMDKIFPNVPFTKEDVKNKFPIKLRQNNQPTKAVIEYLCLTNFLIRIDDIDGPSKYQRTGKKLPITTLDEILMLHETKPIKMCFNGGQYAYHEEDGLYAVLP